MVYDALRPVELCRELSLYETLLNLTYVDLYILNYSIIHVLHLTNLTSLQENSVRFFVVNRCEILDDLKEKFVHWI